MSALFPKFEEIRYSIYNRLSPMARIFLGIVLCIAALIFALHDHPVANAVAGGTAFFASLLFAKEFSAWCDERKLTRLRNSRPRYPDRAVRIPVAQIANDLVPLVDKLSLKDSKLLLVGYDGGYILGKNKNLWRDSLSEWLKKGLNVEYILINPSRDAIDAFENIKEQAKGEVGKLEIWELKDPDRLAESERLKTCHPTLFYGGDNKTKAMWIEGDHPPGSSFAYDVTYVPPGAMNDEQNGKFNEYESMIESLKKRCREMAA